MACAVKIFSILYYLIALGSAFDRHITRQDYGDCEHAVGVINSTMKNYEFSRYFEISKIKYNYKNEDEILRTRMFFRGKSRFEAFLWGGTIPSPNEKGFLSSKYWFFIIKRNIWQFVFIVIAFGKNNQESAIFFENQRYNSETGMKCNHVSNIDNMFHETYFEVVDLVINKKGLLVFFFWLTENFANLLLEGSIKWFIPNQLNPFLMCHEEEIRKIEYITFYTSDENKAFYYFDCPEKDHINYVDLVDVK